MTKKSNVVEGFLLRSLSKYLPLFERDLIQTISYITNVLKIKEMQDALEKGVV
mgnify:CR=1 FL=1